MIDPSISLGVRPVEIDSPLQSYAKALSLKNMVQQNQLGQLQLQQERQKLSDDQNFRQLYAQSLQTGQDIPDSQVLKTLGPVSGAQFLKAKLEATETRARVTDLADKHAEANNDYMAGLALAVKDAGYTPDAARLAVAKANADGHKTEAAQINQLIETNPQAIRPFVDQAISRSPKVMNAMSARDTANARTKQAAIQEQSADDRRSHDDQQLLINNAQLDATVKRDQETARYHGALEQGAATSRLETQRHDLANEALGDRRADNSDRRTDDYESRDKGSVQGRFDQRIVQQQRGLLNQIHNQRIMLGNAISAEDGRTFVDPKTGKVSTQEMTPELRNTFKQQYQNLTQQGQRIIDTYGDEKSGYVIRSNEFSPGSVPASTGKQASSTPQTPSAPTVLKPPTPRAAGSKGSVPLAKVQEYAQKTGKTLESAKQDFANYGYSIK